MNLIDLFTKRGVVVTTTTEEDIDARLRESNELAQVGASADYDLPIPEGRQYINPIVFIEEGRQYIDLDKIGAVQAQLAQGQREFEYMIAHPSQPTEASDSEWAQLNHGADAWIVEQPAFQRSPVTGRPVRR